MSSSLEEYSTAPQRNEASGRDPYRDRTPPYSEAAEQAVISAILLDPNAILNATEYLDDTMFYREGHRRLFQAMLSLSERGDVIDPLTLTDELQRKSELDGVGGRDYIAYLVDVVPTAANIEYHAKIVREKALRRRLIEVSTTIVSEAFESPLPAAELVDQAEHSIFELSQSRGSEGFTRIKELMYDAMERIEQLHLAGESVTGVPSGFKDLDEMTAGFQPSDLVIVAARPSMGKTAFVLNIAQNAALDSKHPIAFFSLEMSKQSLLQRMLTSEARVDAQRLRKGKLRDDEFVQLGRAAGLLSQAPIWIDDTPAISLLEMRSKARRLKVEHNIGLIILDYLQLMQGPPGVENRQQEISTISRSLKALARELRVPVIALSQLSRAPEQRTGDNKRPQLSDLRESGAIEQDADVVMFLYRQEYYDVLEGKDPSQPDKDGKTSQGLAEVIVGKQRNGPTGAVTLHFNRTYTRFENYNQRQGAPNTQ
ncbi:MAG TPA: replicative DNA helicase [Gemmatimonadaceae bacterium]|jgi:replicative DNA helicase|nr:replicative DNA helicase [Gemmatimonadaceae bacterium]